MRRDGDRGKTDRLKCTRRIRSSLVAGLYLLVEAISIDYNLISADLMIEVYKAAVTLCLRKGTRELIWIKTRKPERRVTKVTRRSISIGKFWWRCKDGAAAIGWG